MLIAIEGIDSSGKNTQTEALAKRIRATGREVVTYSFPRYDTPLGQAIKRLLKGDTCLTWTDTATDARGDEALVLQSLMLMDKADATEEIAEHVNDGTIVICDRWLPSTICYGTGDGLDPEWLRRIIFPLPDAALNVFIDVSPEEALRRRPDTRDRYERDREKQARVHAEYVKLWGCEQGQERIIFAPDPYYQVYYRLNGEQPQEKVAEAVFTAVTRHRVWTDSLRDAPRARTIEDAS